MLPSPLVFAVESGVNGVKLFASLAFAPCAKVSWRLLWSRVFSTLRKPVSSREHMMIRTQA